MRHGRRRVSLMTTNDNIDALRFYLRRGYRITSVSLGAVNRARTMKPSIPLVAANGIPISDQLTLVKVLDCASDAQSRWTNMTATTQDLTWIQQTENEHQLPLYAKREIALVRGEGPYLFDSDGRRYLDAMSNYGVAILGHADAEYAAALTDQLGTLATGHQSFYSDVTGRALAELSAIAPPGLTRYFLSNSGAEAIEAAIKFARVATGRSRLVAAKRATTAAHSARWRPPSTKYRAPFEPLAPSAPISP